MGLFSLLGDCVRAIGNKIGDVVEDVGIIVGSDTIRNIGRGIQDICTKQVAEEKSYDKHSADIHTTQRLNEILVSFSEGYLEEATRLEKNSIQIVENFYDNLVDIVQKGPLYNKAELRRLKSAKERIKREIDGKVREPLAKRMSLDDTECLKILKMDSGAEKAKAMKKFSQKVIKEALGNLSKAVKTSFHEQIEDIKDYFENISEEQEKELLNLKQFFDNVCSANEKENGSIEKNCMEAVFVMDTIREIEKLLA